jgi:hypothetical protein
VSNELVPVTVGECQCPGTSHPDGDVVYLRPKLGLRDGIVLQEPVSDWLQIAPAERPGQEYMRGELSERYLILGIAGWNLEDEDGPIPVNPVSIRENLLNDYERSQAAAEKGDELYSDVALGPLRRLVSMSSRPTSNNGSTSPTRSGSPKRRKPSRPSSTTTTRTADIVKISA